MSRYDDDAFADSPEIDYDPYFDQPDPLFEVVAEFVFDEDGLEREWARFEREEYLSPGTLYGDEPF